MPVIAVSEPAAAAVARFDRGSPFLLSDRVLAGGRVVTDRVEDRLQESGTAVLPVNKEMQVIAQTGLSSMLANIGEHFQPGNESRGPSEHQATGVDSR